VRSWIQDHRNEIYCWYRQGRNEGGKRGKIPRAPNHCGGAKSLRGVPENPNNITTTFFNTVDLLPKDLKFEHGGAKLASCPEHHITSLRPWIRLITAMVSIKFTKSHYIPKKEKSSEALNLLLLLRNCKRHHFDDTHPFCC